VAICRLRLTFLLSKLGSQGKCQLLGARVEQRRKRDHRLTMTDVTTESTTKPGTMLICGLLQIAPLLCRLTFRPHGSHHFTNSSPRFMLSPCSFPHRPVATGTFANLDKSESKCCGE
jgi:hypothetical protein